MKRFSGYWLLVTGYLLLAVSCVQTSAFYRFDTAGPVLEKPPCLQVLLTAYKEVEQAEVTLLGAYEVRSYLPRRSDYFTSGQVLTKGHSLNKTIIRPAADGLEIGDEIINADDIILLPVATGSGKNGLIEIGARPYRGRLRIKSFNNKIVLINIIDLENYLYGVVSSEMNSAFPPHALSAQAVAARSFALARIKRSQIKQANPYDADLTDDVFTQVYRGEERTTPKIYETVDNTRGVVLIYEGRLFDSIFHDTCGGQTEPINLIWEGPAVPPLNGRICGYCYGSKFNHWTVAIDEQEIIKKLNLENASGIDDIRVIESAPGGHCRTLGIKIHGKVDEIIINAQQFRIAIGPNKLYSTYFKIKKDGTVFEFDGRGWGHGVGMCQEGARGMAEKGFNTLRVLEYYYPGAKVVKIY